MTQLPMMRELQPLTRPADRRARTSETAWSRLITTAAIPAMSDYSVFRSGTALWIVAAILALAILFFALPPASFYVDSTLINAPLVGL